MVKSINNMTGRKVKVRSQVGGTTNTNKLKLCNLIYSKAGVKFSKLITTPDSFVVICSDDKSVDTMITAETTKLVKNNEFEAVIPPHLWAWKTVILKGLDKEITEMEETLLKEDIEKRNSWAKVEEVIAMKNIPYMLKVRFEEIAMATKATQQGICICCYHIGHN